MNSINHAWPYKIQPKPNVCPGCGRCNECGRGPYVQPYVQPYAPLPWPTYPGPIWISTTNNTTSFI